MKNHKRGGIIFYIIIAVAIFFVLNYFDVTAGKIGGLFSTVWYGYIKPVLVYVYDFLLNYIILPAGTALKNF